MTPGVPCVCPDCLAEVGVAPALDVDSCPSCGYVRPAEGWLVDPLTGLILAGRYRLEGRLGAGGMASVFKAARVGSLGGKVAVKVLAPRLSRTVVARRFEREARVVSHLSSPHIVRIYDFDTFTFPGSAQPLYFIAMELVDGTSLSQLLRKQGDVNFMWAIDVLRQTARGLDDAHTNGVVHRDLKPSNIMLRQQREATHVKIVDFGIAGLAELEGEEVEKLTQTGFVSGTPDYMAPEQCIGSQPVGPPADIYSLGVVAFELFTGVRPFAGDSLMDVLMQRVTRPAPALREAMAGRELPPDIYRIVDKMLARKPEDRYQSAGDLLEDLARFPAMMTRPDLPVTTAELAELSTVSAQQAVTQAAEPAAGGDVQIAPTAVAQPATVPPESPPTATATATAAITAPPPSPRSRWPWVTAGVVLIGGGAAAAAVLLGGEPTPDPPAPRTTGAPHVAHVGPDTLSTSAPTSDVHVASVADAVARVDAVGASTADTRPAEMAPDASAPVAADTTAATASPTGLLLDGPRPPLETGFMAYRVPVGGDELTVAVAEPLPPLYQRLAVRLALDRDGQAIRLVDATVAVKLASTSDAVGTSTGRGRDDGRVAVDLPPLPVSARYTLVIDAQLGDGSTARWTLSYDASKGVPAAR